MAFWDGIPFEVLDPPLVEGAVGANKERLLRWGRLRKGVGDVCAKNKEVFSRGNCVEQSGAGLFDEIGISFGKDEYFTRTS